jgi:hypothetical protein
MFMTRHLQCLRQFSCISLQHRKSSLSGGKLIRRNNREAVKTEISKRLMPHSIFISYARKTSRESAEALRRELGGEDGLAFLDTTDIEAGEHFPKAQIEALLDAKVVVVFVNETCFKRWYCLRELRTALAPFEALLRRGVASDQQKAAALEYVEGTALRTIEQFKI